MSLDGLNGDGSHMEGTIEDLTFLGSIVRNRVRFGENPTYFDQFNNPRLAPPQRGQPVTIIFPRESVLVMGSAIVASD